MASDHKRDTLARLARTLTERVPTVSARVMSRYSAEAVQRQIDKDPRISKREALDRRRAPGSPRWPSPRWSRG